MIQSCLGEGVVIDAAMPFICRQPADDSRGCCAMTVIDDFHQIVSVGWLYGSLPPLSSSLQSGRQFQ